MSDHTPITSRPEYWTTLSEYEGDEEFVSRAGEEFHPGAKPERLFEAEDAGESLVDPITRRSFLKLSGFAALAAAVAGCERPVQKILPYVNKPEEVSLGISNHYASTCTECPAACGLLVTSREGRPIKLEGNPQHPVNRGTLCPRGQAGLLNLYDPERLKYPVRIGREGNMEYDSSIGFAGLYEEIGGQLGNGQGKVVLLTPTVTGPANERLIEEFLAQGDNFEHVVYDPASGSGSERRAYQLSFGEEVTPRYRFAEADVVLCLGGDPLGQSPSRVEVQRDFAAKRKVREEGISRVYAFEPAPTMTGAQADYRHRVRPDGLLPLALAFARELIVERGLGGELAENGQMRELLDPWTVAAAADRTGVPEEEIRRAADSLALAPGRCIVHVAGGASRTEDELGLHLAGILLNQALGSYEQTIDIASSPSRQAQGSEQAMLDLLEEMRAGEVAVLLMSGVNPAYTLPATAGVEEAFANVPLVVSLGLRMDETAALADYALPAVHGLESWGDAEPQRGLYSVQQPMIRTIFGELANDERYDTRPWQESLMALLTESGSEAFLRTPEVEEPEDEEEEEEVEVPEPELMSWYDFLRETWRERVYREGALDAGDFESFWTAAVQLGAFDTVGDEDRHGALPQPEFNAGALADVEVSEAGSGMALVLHPTNVHGDGVTMGNPFLLELPDAISRICWDNYASLAPSTAEAMGVREGDHLRVSAGGEEIEIPAFIQPGVHADVVAIHLGWGRNTFGGIGDGVGVNAAPLIGRGNGSLVYSGRQVQVERVRGRTRLANVQGHNYLHSPSYAGVYVNRRKGENIPEEAPYYDRPIIGETTFEEWRENPYHAYPNSTPHGELPRSIWGRQHRYAGHHWGLSVDLNACNGCGACMVACSIENNVPVVGKEEVLRGREMHWMRIDRYYRGNKENPDIVHQPLMCQHCDHAPCETVCPVIATMHNDEGLNVMTYNRCVGTRYCSNNCPYKVRRFNFWQYSDFRTGPHENVRRVSPLELVLNPDVTTRTRGVMEKCTFCIQRIRHAKDDARDRGEPLRDGEMVTACQQTCPAQAISFGDRNDPNSEIAAHWEDPRAYGLLEDINTDPSVRYLAMVRNRDEPVPYRTKYQAHRVDGYHGPGGQ